MALNARDEARTLLPENFRGWDCDGSASICDRRVEAIRALLDEPVPADAAQAFRDYAAQVRRDWFPNSCPWVGAIDDHAARLEAARDAS